MHDARDQLIGRLSVRQGFVRQYQAVAQHIRYQIADVFGQHVVAATQKGQCASPLDEIDTRARTGAKGDVAANVIEAVGGRGARGSDEFDSILNQHRIDIGIAALLLQRGELFGGSHRVDIDRRAGDPFDDDKLFGFARVADEDFHHEAIHLCFWQRVGALGFNRILCCHDQKRLRYFVRLAGDGDLPFLHYLEQRALHFGRRAVDFIGQQQIGKHRAKTGAEFA